MLERLISNISTFQSNMTVQESGLKAMSFSNDLLSANDHQLFVVGTDGYYWRNHQINIDLYPLQDP